MNMSLEDAFLDEILQALICKVDAGLVKGVGGQLVMFCGPGEINETGDTVRVAKSLRHEECVPKWGWVAGYEWSVDSGHDDDRRCSVAKEKTRGGQNPCNRLGRPAWYGRLLDNDLRRTNDHQ